MLFKKRQNKKKWRERGGSRNLSTDKATQLTDRIKNLNCF